MSAVLKSSIPTYPAETKRPTRSASPEVIRSSLIALGLFVGIAWVGLGTAQLINSTALFDIVIWVLVTVLWIAFAAALAFSPGTLDDVWHSVRELPFVMQGVTWLVSLPVMIGLLIWEQSWFTGIRLAFLMGLSAGSIVILFPWA